MHDSTMSFLIDEKMLNMVRDRDVIVELIDFIIDDLNLSNVNILLKRSDTLQVKQVLQFMHSLFVCQLIPDLSLFSINTTETFDPYEWIGLSCEL
ncbi:hypothetical protein CANMA_004624 [Candida margitis]|uniref:uncharacterized protein n=1 Tax=Candida margitis TaxID=1775924 RepID=UPI0022278A8E|nr:uncharacterized protein CANMA_004624 [Candida margitis]KAI5955407.1 hypothetical protein CANMA_004624 [Candida margitis]